MLDTLQSASSLVKGPLNATLISFRPSIVLRCVTICISGLYFMGGAELKGINPFQEQFSTKDSEATT